MENKMLRPLIQSPGTRELIDITIESNQGSSPFSPSATPKVSVVIPALNEARNLPHVLRLVPQWLHEVVLVDGRSTDGTVEIARSLWPNNHVVTKERRNRAPQREPAMQDRRSQGITLRLVDQKGRGKGSAMREGFEAATGDIIVVMDADGSNDPNEIPAFLGVLLAGADFAKGSRFLQGGGTLDMPLYRKLGNWSFVLIVRLLFGGSYTDLCYGYNAFWSRIVRDLKLEASGFEIETLMNVRAQRLGLKIAEVPSFEYKRIYGESNLRTIPDGWRVVKTILNEGVKHYRGILKVDPQLKVRVPIKETIYQENDRSVKA